MKLSVCVYIYIHTHTHTHTHTHIYMKLRVTLDGSSHSYRDNMWWGGGEIRQEKKETEKNIKNGTPTLKEEKKAEWRSE